MQVLRKLWMLIRRDRFHRELAEEMAFHRAQTQQELEASGMSASAARQKAAKQFGNEGKLREESHAAVHFRFESLWRDARYAARQMRRAPGFTLAVVLTLTLGIGANTAIFSVVQSTLLRPLPYAQAERIISIQDARLQGVSTGGLGSGAAFFSICIRATTPSTA